MRAPARFGPKSRDPAAGHNKSRASLTPLTRSITAPLTRLQIQSDYLWGATLVEIRYLVREKELIDALCWLHEEATRTVAAGANADNERLTQIYRFIESYTANLHRVWDNIAKLRGTYPDSDEE